MGKFVYREDISKFIILAIMFLAFGFITSHWEGHIAYGWNPFWMMWLLLVFPIGMVLRYFANLYEKKRQNK